MIRSLAGLSLLRSSLSSSSRFSPNLSRNFSSSHCTLFPSLTCTVSTLPETTPVAYQSFGCTKLSNSIATLTGNMVHVATINPPTDPAELPELKFIAETKMELTFGENKLFTVGDKLFTFGTTNNVFNRKSKSGVQLYQVLYPEEGISSIGGYWSHQQMAEQEEPLQSFYSARIGHRLFVLGETYYNEINDLPCSLLVYDFNQDEWSQPEVSGEGPEEKQKLMAFSYKNKLMVFSPSLTSTYDLFVLDVDTMEWTEQYLSFPDGVDPPFVRSTGCTLNVMGNKAVLFGGLHMGMFRRDVDVLDLDTFSWIKVDVEGEELPKKSGHGAVTLNDHRIMVLGGNTSALKGDDTVRVFEFH